jgi:non-specific serine/threonine protein kinase
VWDFYKPDRSLYERIFTEQRALLGEASFNKAWAEGRAMTLREAADYALSDDEKPVPLTPPLPEQAPTRTYSLKLSRREQEVVALAARGMTNRQIAANLSISKHTAATHVRRILKKLGLQSRSQIGSLLAEQRPSSTDPD